MHRDLKTSNVVIDSNGIVKLIDFNSAKISGKGDVMHTKQATTLYYSSPEQLFSSQKYGLPTDMWSLGCIFAELWNRNYLFPGTGQIDQLCKIFDLRGSITSENWPTASECPDYMEFSESEAKDLAAVFPNMTKQGVDFLDKLL